MMKHNTGNRRSRNRNGGKRQGGGGRGNFESNGPEVKVRGTAQQVLEKYLALARDAASAGDRVKSESYFQFAEHYHRISNADSANSDGQNRRDDQTQQEQTQQVGEADVNVVPDEVRPKPVLGPVGEPEVVQAMAEKGKIPESEDAADKRSTDDDPDAKSPSVSRRRRRLLTNKEAGTEPAPEPEVA